VVKYSAEGELLTEWSVVAGVIETNGMAVGPGGEVYVNINNNHRVVKYSAEGEILDEWGGEGSEPGQFLSPTGVAVSEDGLVYIADSGNNRIQVFLR
jgi:DNA-binding beta-propeller fold protein YncE